MKVRLIDDKLFFLSYPLFGQWRTSGLLSLIVLNIPCVNIALNSISMCLSWSWMSTSNTVKLLMHFGNLKHESYILVNKRLDGYKQ